MGSGLHGLGVGSAFKVKGEGFPSLGTPGPIAVLDAQKGCLADLVNLKP